MKSVNEVLTKAKGSDKVNDIMTGKGAFSKTGFSDLVSALCNDTTYQIPTYDKDGKQNGTINISELIRKDVKASLEKANYPQKSEAGVLDSSELVVKGMAEAIPYIIMQQLSCGKKFELPAQPNTSTTSLFLRKLPGRTREVTVRDPKTQETIGTSTITTKDSIQLCAKSPVPDYLTVKVRKDKNGKTVA